jgi:hypothetical protein
MTKNLQGAAPELSVPKSRGLCFGYFAHALRLVEPGGGRMCQKSRPQQVAVIKNSKIVSKLLEEIVRNTQSSDAQEPR